MIAPNRRTCTMPDCARKCVAHGLCHKHYHERRTLRQYRIADPLCARFLALPTTKREAP